MTGMSKPFFPILRLPLVVLRKVILSLNLIELVDFTFCSRRCRKVIRSIVGTNRYTMTIHFSPDGDIVLRSKFDDNRLLFYGERMEERNKYFDPSLVGEDFSNDFEVQIKWMYKWLPYIYDIFHCEIQYLFIFHYPLIGHLNDIAIGLKRLGIPIKECVFQSYGILTPQRIPLINDEIEFFFNTVEILDRLFVKFDSMPVPNSKFLPVFEYTFSEIHSGDSEWVSMKNLISCSKKCTRIELMKTYFTSEDINLFLKELLDGNLPNLQYFLVELKGNVGLEAVLKGLEIFKLEEPVDFEYEDISIYKRKYTFNCEVEVQGSEEIKGKCTIQPVHTPGSAWDKLFFFSVY